VFSVSADVEFREVNTASSDSSDLIT
jgi:hypothetical protein